MLLSAKIYWGFCWKQLLNLFICLHPLYRQYSTLILLKAQQVSCRIRQYLNIIRYGILFVLRFPCWHLMSVLSVSKTQKDVDSIAKDHVDYREGI